MAESRSNFFSLEEVLSALRILFSEKKRNQKIFNCKIKSRRIRKTVVALFTVQIFLIVWPIKNRVFILLEKINNLYAIIRGVKAVECIFF